MNQQEALEILVQAVRLANKRGAYEIEESEQIAQAIKVFSQPQPQPESNQDPTNPLVTNEVSEK